MSANPAVFSADQQNFQTDVIDASRAHPVVVLFWAEQMPESVEAKRTLETQVGALQGKLSLALVDVALDQTLAQHLRVQTLPSIRVVQDGQLAEQLDGPQTAAALAELCSRLTLSSSDMLQAQLGQILDSGDFEAALTLLQQAIDEEPQNMAFRVELADVLVQQGKLDDARGVLAAVPEDTAGIARPRTRLELADEALALPSLDELSAQVAANESDLATLHSYAIALAAAGQLEPALEAALDILCADRKFRDDIGRLTMLRIFELCPKGSELATGFRRRMFNFMH